MTPETFHERIHLVINRLGKNAPPHELFAGGVEDWHARARLAHFLAQMPEQRAEAIELFQSVMDAEVNEELAQDVEEKSTPCRDSRHLRRRKGNTGSGTRAHQSCD